jgi:hypothetical protein
MKCQKDLQEVSQKQSAIQTEEAIVKVYAPSATVLVAEI